LEVHQATRIEPTSSLSSRDCGAAILNQLQPESMRGSSIRDIIRRPGVSGMLVTEPGSLLMQRRVSLGNKKRAEGTEKQQ
jgi:hypothetical protein